MDKQKQREYVPKAVRSREIRNAGQTRYGAAFHVGRSDPRRLRRLAPQLSWTAWNASTTTCVFIVASFTRVDETAPQNPHIQDCARLAAFDRRSPTRGSNRRRTRCSKLRPLRKIKRGSRSRSNEREAERHPVRLPLGLAFFFFVLLPTVLASPPVGARRTWLRTKIRPLVDAIPSYIASSRIKILGRGIDT